MSNYEKIDDIDIKNYLCPNCCLMLQILSEDSFTICGAIMNSKGIMIQVSENHTKKEIKRLMKLKNFLGCGKKLSFNKKKEIFEVVKF